MVSALYRTIGGQLASASAELPFSQIMETDSTEENTQVSMRLRITGTDIQIDGSDDEGRQLSVTVYYHTMAFLRETREVTLLTDLYSTAYETRYEPSQLDLCSLYESVTRRQTVREVLEIGVAAEAVLSLCADCGAVSVSREGEITQLRTAVTVRALYLDEGGACLSAERCIDVCCPMELPKDCAVSARAFCGEEIQGTLGDRGIEVRFPVDFQVEVCGRCRKLCVASAVLDESTPKDLDNKKGDELMSSNYIRFDWAMKRLLRNKANFAVLEGFLTTLLNEKIIIRKLLESESNQEDEFDKYNRVDMLAENSKGELILIEVQNNNEYAYFQRMLFGTSKLVTEYINRGEGYDKVRKVYSVNIVYFSLGSGKDTVYHGKTEFRGIHQGDMLELTPFQKQTFKVDTVSQLYPEYYILKVNDFNQVAKSPLEEWIYYLNTGDIPDSATAPGLTEARERLKLDKMTKAELDAYYRHLDNIVILKDNIFTERAEGRAEGHAEGRVEGHAEGRVEGINEGRLEEKREAASNMKTLNIPLDVISQVTGLSIEEIKAL